MASFWKTEFIVPFGVIPHIDGALEDFFKEMSWYAVLPDNQREVKIESDEPWRLEAITAEKPDIAHLKTLLDMFAIAYGFDVPDVQLVLEEERDWIAENLEQFPPIEADDFYIYGSHIPDKIPQGKIGIKMDASTAFGTGQHATTKSCLLALSWLKKQKIEVKQALDMGAGSGILSFAMAKLWDCDIWAVDIDEGALSVIERYATENQVENKITALLGNGYHTQAIKQSESFDCIAANILANPLIDMAPMMVDKLKSKGYVVLSGFLTADWQRVQKAHEDCGLNAISHYIEEDWVALIMQKN